MDIAFLKTLTIWLAAGIELAAAMVIAVAMVEAVVRIVGAFRAELRPGGETHAALDRKQEIRLRLGRWLAIALEFLLAADILKTAVAPSWTEIGQLAAIATLRTALNYFLQREIDQSRVGSDRKPGRDEALP
ncbi:DUF1622 domain-containing protein [uncultured Brevundimonas sp.]|uniref:DUF1622 domain-containing protein n=1 Tax=uncultured Brevundimonas sp. TaxID=213418 RepID=UPI0030EC6F9C|tara:strand:+ start:33403 stop:33798 length:396 start_codon:yes stop_codon:yes gene_type:complete